MLIPEKEHQCHRVVKLIHLFKVWDLVEITDVKDSEVFDSVRDFVENLILTHTICIPVTTEANNDKTFFFGHYGLIDVPSCDEVGKDYGTHSGKRKALKGV